MNCADILIIGGGAAGLMAAARISHTPYRVVLLEKRERFGRKLLLTGKGRCNLTNMCPWDEFQRHLHPDAGFLKHAFSAFGNAAVADFFRQAGLDTKVERGERLFPVSESSSDVLDTLLDVCRKGGVHLLSEREVLSVDPLPEEQEVRFRVRTLRTGMEKMSEEWSARRVIVCTGGLSYPVTGSTGDGYRMAADTGHQVMPRFPALTALMPQAYPSALSGLELKNVRLGLEVGGTLVRQEDGEFSCTELGFEGALAFRLSRQAVWAMNSGDKVAVILDLKPGLTKDQLFARIRREKAANPGLRFRELLRKLMPAALIGPFLQAHPSLTEERLPDALKCWRFPLASYGGYARAIVTGGGVSLKDVSRKTMESKIVKGMYFAGEVLDLDGDTGGYNLQIAFSTASAAALAAARTLAEKTVNGR